MDRRLYLSQWNEIDKDEKKSIIGEIIRDKNIPFKITGVEVFSQNNMTVETVVMQFKDSEFIFVPGMMDVTLGWDKSCIFSDDLIHDLKEDKLDEIEYYKEEYEEIKEEYEEDIKSAKENGNQVVAQNLTEKMHSELGGYDEYLNIDLDEYIESFKRIIINSSSNLRRVNINPMIVERNLNNVSEYNSYNEFRESLGQTDFTIPTEDEYEYLCAGGRRTLFRWGDSLKKELDSIYRIGSIEDSDNILCQPNMFGLYILYDSYMYELVDSECFYKGGDGGCSLCGGEGAIYVLPVFSTFNRPYVSKDTSWNIDKQYCYYRRILHI